MQRFGAEQLSSLEVADIVDNTATLVAASAFFAGAWQALAGDQERQFADSQAGLSRYLAQCFHLSEENAAGLLDAVARLARRYCYIEDAHRLGMLSAREWSSGQHQGDSRLAPYLRRHAHITMAELGFAGVKETVGAAGGVSLRHGGRVSRWQFVRRNRGLAWVLAMLLLVLLLTLAGWYWLGGAVEMPW